VAVATSDAGDEGNGTLQKDRYDDMIVSRKQSWTRRLIMLRDRSLTLSSSRFMYCQGKGERSAIGRNQRGG